MRCASFPIRSVFHGKLQAVAALALMAAVVTAGCRSPQRRVQHQVGQLRHTWKTNVAHQSDLPERTMDWPTAVSELRAHNLKLIQARTEATNSQEMVRQIFRDLTPTLNLRSGVTKDLKNLGATTIDDVTFSLDSFFNLPGLVSFSARLYAARLFQLRAGAASELTEREQTIELYKLFLDAQDKQRQQEHLSRQRTTAAAIREVDAFSGQMLLTETGLRELAEQRETASLQQRASDLFGSHAYRWSFVTNGLPQLNYEVDPISLDDTNRIAQLQMKLVAVELEAARAQQTGIKLRYWPELNIFISGPPIYQRAAGVERFWDAGTLRGSADLFWYIDTRGQISRQLRQTRRQQALQQERLRQEALALIDRLLLTQRLLRATQEKAREIDQQIEVLKAVPPVQNFGALQKYAEDYRVLVEQQRQVRRDLAELSTLFWFVDEHAWPVSGSNAIAALKN